MQAYGKVTWDAAVGSPIGLPDVHAATLVGARRGIPVVGTCVGSDLHLLSYGLPVTMGHEFAGTVVAAGPGAGVAEGARVTVTPACCATSAAYSGEVMAT